MARLIQHMGEWSRVLFLPVAPLSVADKKWWETNPILTGHLASL